jgi:hypothetical protein
MASCSESMFGGIPARAGDSERAHVVAPPRFNAYRHLTSSIALSLAILCCTAVFAQSEQTDTRVTMDNVTHLQDFQVIEFRRYIVKEDERQRFEQYFDAWFPEAFEQLGAIAFGEFFETGNRDGFNWLMGFFRCSAPSIRCVNRMEPKAR